MILFNIYALKDVGRCVCTGVYAVVYIYINDWMSACVCVGLMIKTKSKIFSMCKNHSIMNKSFLNKRRNNISD